MIYGVKVSTLKSEKKKNIQKQKNPVVCDG